MSAEKKPARKVVRLTRSESFALDTWVNAHREEIEKGEWTFDSIAKLLTPDVSPNLNAMHVRYSIRSFNIKMGRKAGKASNRRQLVYRKSIRMLCEQIIVMRDALHAAGVTFDMNPRIVAIATGKSVA